VLCGVANVNASFQVISRRMSIAAYCVSLVGPLQYGWCRLKSPIIIYFSFGSDCFKMLRRVVKVPSVWAEYDCGLGL
jgi:hypothetical protein